MMVMMMIVIGDDGDDDADDDGDCDHDGGDGDDGDDGDDGGYGDVHVCVFERLVTAPPTSPHGRHGKARCETHPDSIWLYG